MKTLSYDTEGSPIGPNPWLDDHYTIREGIYTWWSEMDCPSAITIAVMAPEFSPSERAGQCLIWDEERETYAMFSEGGVMLMEYAKIPERCAKR